MTDTTETITPELRAALGRLRAHVRRYKNLPGYHENPMELGDWTLIHRAIDGVHEPTRAGLPDPPGTYPEGSRIVANWPAVAAAMGRLKEISEFAQAVLLLEGPRRPAIEEDRRLTELLDAKTLPHDWELIAALIGGGDE